MFVFLSFLFASFFLPSNLPLFVLSLSLYFFLFSFFISFFPSFFFSYKFFLSFLYPCFHCCPFKFIVLFIRYNYTVAPCKHALFQPSTASHEFFSINHFTTQNSSQLIYLMLLVNRFFFSPFIWLVIIMFLSIYLSNYLVFLLPFTHIFFQFTLTIMVRSYYHLRISLYLHENGNLICFSWLLPINSLFNVNRMKCLIQFKVYVPLCSCFHWKCPSMVKYNHLHKFIGA